MTHIIKFDPERISPEQLGEVARQIRDVMDSEDIIMVLPYGLDFLMDVPVDELIRIRNQINEIINSRSFS